MIVIADDITGAAEIAGIAKAKGLSATLLCASTTEAQSSSVTVIATDTRSLSEQEASAETRRIAAPYKGSSARRPFIYKKTDSALRGHVVAELKAMLQATGLRRAVYAPANPSKGRIIRGGVYYIKEVKDDCPEPREVPISETAFSYDPEFPARTSSLRDRFPDAEAAGIIMPDVESRDDLRRIIWQYNDGTTLFAGAADLFEALIEASDSSAPPSSSVSPTSPASASTPASSSAPSSAASASPVAPPAPFSASSAPSVAPASASSFSVCTDSVGAPSSPSPSPSPLILCGSTQSRPLSIGIPICPMPREVYDGEKDASFWFQQLHAPLSPLILTIPHTHRTGKTVAVHLRTVMAEMACLIIAQHCPPQLIIEGGATAWAVLQALGWTQFRVERQIAPGVVQMSATNGTLVTLKPGSYPWGGLFSLSESR